MWLAVGILGLLARPTDAGDLGGRVTRADNAQGVANVFVAAYTYPGGAFLNSAMTALDGSYVITGLPSGQVAVRTIGAASAGLVDEFHLDRSCPGVACTAAAATPVTIGAGGTTVNFSLDAGATIAGRVQAADTGRPLADVLVWAEQAIGGRFVGQLSGQSAPDGAYAITGLPAGTYRLRAIGAASYIDQVYAPPEGIDCPGPACDTAAATPVTVTNGQTVVGHDFSLRRGGTIRGRVVATATGEPLRFAALSAALLVDGRAYPVEGEFFVDEAGNYTIDGLPTGGYDVRTLTLFGDSPLVLVDEVFDDRPCPGARCPLGSGLPVTVVAGQVTAGVDFALDQGGQFRGRVRDVTTECGQACPGVPGVVVEVHSPDGALVATTESHFDGGYASPGLPAGSYRAVARGGSAGFTDELFEEKPCTATACDPASGDPITVTVPGSRQGVDFSLRALPLAIEDVWPSFGPLAGGTRVTISGTRFGSPASVTLGGIPAQVRAASSTRIDIVTPPGTRPGAVDVVVTVPAGVVTRPGGFTYAPRPTTQDLGTPNGATRHPSLSADGRYVAFVSAASNLVDNDTNGVDDVFVRDRATGRVVRVSVADDGTEGNGPSRYPRISASGRHVAFLSAASQLVPGDANGVADVFVHDRDADGDGVFDEPDGRATFRVSLSSAGVEANAASGPPDISPDGFWVAFASAASNLVPLDTNGVDDVFLHHWPSGQTSRVSVASTGAQANGASRAPSLSARAQRIVFASDATNLVDGDGNGRRDVFLHDRGDGSTVRISTAAGTAGIGDANGDSDNPSIDDIGRTVAFETSASNILPGSGLLPGVSQIVVFVLPAGSQTTARAVAPVVNIGAAIRSLVSGNAQGQPGSSNSSNPEVSGDGNAVGFESAASNLVPGDTNGTADAFVAGVSADGQTMAPSRVSVDAAGNESQGASSGVALNGDGTAVSFESTAALTTGTSGAPMPQVFVSGGTLQVTRLLPDFAVVGSATGLVIEGAGFEAGVEVRLGTTRVTAVRESTTRIVVTQVPSVSSPSLVDVTVVNPDGQALTLPAAFSFVAPPNTSADSDGDGLPDEWEARWHLDPLSAAGADGADGDPDGDGARNRDEFAAGTHPRGTFVRFLAEGASGAFFSTRFAMANPSATQTATALLRFQKATGAPASAWVTVPPQRSRRIVASDVAGMAAAEFATVVESDVPLVIDREMTWDPVNRYGTHAETALRGPSTIWYLAEGATHSGFELFYLLQNPSDTAAVVDVQYLQPSGPPLLKSYTVAPRSRFNIWVDYEEFPDGSGNLALANAEVSAVLRVTNGVPIIVERAMYLTRPGQLFAAGHASAGVTAPALDWFLAEGATGDLFDLFVLLANPNPVDAAVRVTYLLDGGGTFRRTMTVPAQSRQNIWVDYDTPDGTTGYPLARAELSTRVEVTNGVPIIVERAMWWPFDIGRWQEAHNSPGSTVTGTLWGIADGEVNGAPWYTSTYILVANPTARDASVDVTLLFEDIPPVTRTFGVASNGRLTIDVGHEFPESTGLAFGAVVESRSDGTAPAVPVVVERARYHNALGMFWAAGSNELATRLR